ncbi:MAG: phenylacetate--CoA ligase family protein [Gammaproteobacteria bacterium]
MRELLKQLEYSQWFSPEELREYQLTQLKPLLRHALATVPYYAKAFSGLDVDRLDWGTFTALPRLGRLDLQGQFDALRSRAVPRSHGPPTEGQSSGSTGTPVRFLRTTATQFYWHTLTVREHLWHQRDFAGKLAAIRVRVEDGNLPSWGSPVASLYRTGPAALLNVKADTSSQLDWLVREDPDYLLTHASNLGALAELSLRRGVRLPRLRQARSFSEALRPELRDTVRASWGVDVADVYSCEEAGYIGLQCPKHEHYHAQAESLVVEVLDPEGKPCTAGQTGEIVLTTLHNFATPLIRYRLGDYAEVGPACPCGRGLPVLARIHGRQRNMLLLPDGRQMWPSFPSSMWTDVAPLEQFQVVQRSDRNLEINYVMARSLTTEEEQRLAAALIARLGCEFNFDWHHRGKLERSQGGKFEDFISQMPAASIPA